MLPAHNPSALQDLDAVILVGGQGTRLRTVVADRPKPLAEVAGRPFLSYVLDFLAAHGVWRVTLCTGHRAEMVPEALGDRQGVIRLAYSRETQPLGTAGAVLAALRTLESSTILVGNGDSLCQADLRAFLEFHRRQGCGASILLTHVHDCSRFGQVICDEHQRIVSFSEKHAGAGPGWINAGLYLIERRVLAAFSASPLSFERDVFPALIRDAATCRDVGPIADPSYVQREICGWPGGGAFLDIGTPESLAQAESFLGDHANVRAG
jgi:D-glycero-alpha-D-manno-heptose 1-phosphate guanylyltransferase